MIMTSMNMIMGRRGMTIRTGMTMASMSMTTDMKGMTMASMDMTTDTKDTTTDTITMATAMGIITDTTMAAGAEWAALYGQS